MNNQKHSYTFIGKNSSNNNTCRYVKYSFITIGILVIILINLYALFDNSTTEISNGNNSTIEISTTEISNDNNSTTVISTSTLRN